MRNRILPWFAGPLVGFLVGLRTLRHLDDQGKALGGPVGVLAVTTGLGLICAALLAVDETLRGRIVAARAAGTSPRRFQAVRIALFVLAYPVLLFVFLAVLALAFA